MQRLWPYLLLSLAGIGWGFGFPTGKIALHALPWQHVITLRLVMAALVALPYALASAEGRRVLRSDRWAWLAGIFNGVGYIVQYAGLARLTVSLSAVLVGLLPALIAAASILWGEKVNRAGWIGVAAATAGAAIIGAGAGPAGGTVSGVLLSVGSLLIFLGYIWSLKKIRPTRDLLAAPAAVLVITGAVAASASVLWFGLPPVNLDRVTWGAMIFAAIGSTVVASAAWQIGLQRAPAASAGVFINLEPVVGATLGVLAFGDPLTASLVLGGALILAGSVTTVLGGATKEVVPEQA